MTDTDRELGLQDEDRLPWLEAVENDDEDEGMSSTKVIGFVIAALILLSLIIGGIMWLRSQKQGPDGDGTLIAAQEGDYKVKPDAPGGMKVEGQGDAAFAASEGAEANGKINTAANGEAPVAAVEGAAAVKPVVNGGTKPSVSSSVPASGGKLVAPMAPVAGSATGGTQVQLGAFSSEAGANTTWAALVAKTPALAKMAKTVMRVEVGGKTLYRLRANAGSAAGAAAICGQVRECKVVG